MRRGTFIACARRSYLCYCDGILNTSRGGRGGGGGLFVCLTRTTETVDNLAARELVLCFGFCEKRTKIRAAQFPRWLLQTAGKSPTNAKESRILKFQVRIWAISLRIWLKANFFLRNAYFHEICLGNCCLNAKPAYQGKQKSSDENCSNSLVN